MKTDGRQATHEDRWRGLRDRVILDWQRDWPYYLGLCMSCVYFRPSWAAGAVIAAGVTVLLALHPRPPANALLAVWRRAVLFPAGVVAGALLFALPAYFVPGLLLLSAAGLTAYWGDGGTRREGD